MLAVVGVLIIAAALVAATVVRSSDRATLALGERMDVPVVVTEPGVLDAVGPEVTVRATADDDEPVVLAIGRTSEVEAWLGDNDHARVTGLSSWEELTVEVVTAAGTEDALPNPAGSDLWVVETASTGTAELSWTDSPGRWSLVAATDGAGPAPELELEWGREVSTPWLVPAIIIGAIAIVAGATMLVLDVLARREQRRRDDARARREAGGRAASITDTDPGTGERLTRRQIREMERETAGAERNPHADDEAGLPPVPLAAEPVGADDGAAADASDARTDELAGTSETAPGAGDRHADGPEVERDAGDDSTVERAPADGSVVGPDRATDDPAVEPEGSTLEDHPATDAPPAVTTPGDPSDDGEDPDGDEGSSPTPSSWRSVWGFGGAARGRGAPQGPAADTTDQTDQHDDREERR